MATAEGRLLLRISEAAERLGISRTKMYELVGRGAVEAVHIDGAVRVKAEELEAYVNRLGQGEAAR